MTEKEYIFEITFTEYFPFADELIFYTTFFLKEGHRPFMEVDRTIEEKFKGLVWNGGFPEPDYRRVHINLNELPSEELLQLMKTRANDYIIGRGRKPFEFNIITRTTEWKNIT